MEDIYEEDYEDYYIDQHQELTLEDGLSCASQVGKQVFKDVLSLILYNLLYRGIILASQNVRIFKTIPLEPIVSSIFGVSLLYAYFPEGFYQVITFVATSFVVFKILQRSKFLGFYMKTYCIFTLVTWELITTNATAWHKIRGIQMIAAMKLISLAFDHCSEGLGKVPVQNFMGYIFCPANLIYGPWISYKDHCNSLNSRNIKFSPRNLKTIITNATIALGFVVLMNCFLEILIPDSYSKWIVAYRTALGFRSSHYFISFMSQAIISAAGITATNLSRVTNPLNVEFPRSLNLVVTNWNIPMHLWLKKYIFSKLHSVHPFVAVLATYVTSSLLHGLSFQIYGVLVSLAFYTFVEHKFRKKLSERLNICIKATPCKSCNHRKNRYTLAINIIFGILTLWHLTYLGLMFDFSNSQDQGYSFRHTLEKWRSLNFMSHWVVLGTFVVTVFI